MKVSIVVGGRWHAIDLARELHQAGVLHRVITNYPKFKTRAWGVPDHKVVSLPLTLILNRAIPKLGGEPMLRKFLPDIYNLFARAAVRYLEGSTLVHGWSGMSEPALHWAKRHQIPFVLERSSAHIAVQAEILDREYKDLNALNYELDPQLIARELREYQLADRIAVPSLFAQRTFLQQGFKPERLIHNPLGTSLTTFSPGKKQDKVFRVVYAGSLGVRKGIHYLVRAFMAADLPDSELILLGKTTPETPKLLEGADGRVKCLGHVPEVKLAEYYRNSSVFVMPSLEDGFGMVLAQAIACGIPIISTTHTGAEDLLTMDGSKSQAMQDNIQEYPAGYIVPPHNIQAIAVLLKKLAENPELLQSKQQAALNFNPDALNWSAYAQRAIAGYRELLATKVAA
ncbi:MAG: glycosyltransferase family 4 protein [Pleurocapsa sp.]